VSSKKKGDIQRIIQVVHNVQPEKIRYYLLQEENRWPEFAKAIREVGIRNYNLFLRDQDCIVVIYFDYVGPDSEFNDRMEQMDNASRIQEHWFIIGMPLKAQAEGEWSTSMVEEDLRVVLQIPIEAQIEEWLETNMVRCFYQE
jgi:L-rhamnose mutarotase